MKAYQQNKEGGQILILVAVTLIVLLGFTALAIDGGMVFSDRRNAQNAADAAAMAGALQKTNGLSDATAIAAAESSAAANGFGASQVTAQVTHTADILGNYSLVTVDISETTVTSFAHLFGRSTIENQVTATAKVKDPGPVLPGTAIIAMGNCMDSDGPTDLLSIEGGGNSGGILTFDGGMFLNTAENATHDQCAIDLPTSTGTLGIWAEAGYTIASVGSLDYAGESKLTPSPITTGVNNGNPIDDPLASLPEPGCTANGTVTVNGSTKTYTPGFYGGSGQPSIGAGTLEPGIYCISGSIHESGKDEWTGTGVTLYFMDGGIDFSGQANFKITAPTDENCLGEGDDNTDSCTYKGIAIFMARDNENGVSLTGNGEYKITGMVYALVGDVVAKGGGSSADEWVVKGQIIARSVHGTGNGTFIVTYDENNTYNGPASLSLYK